MPPRQSGQSSPPSPNPRARRFLGDPPFTDLEVGGREGVRVEELSPGRVAEWIDAQISFISSVLSSRPLPPVCPSFAFSPFLTASFYGIVSSL